MSSFFEFLDAAASLDRVHRNDTYLAELPCVLFSRTDHC